MNKDILKLAGVINESESDLSDYGNDLSGMAQRYAYNFGVLNSATKVTKDILESALRYIEDPEWDQEKDSAVLLKYLDKEVRKAIGQLESSNKYLRPDPK